MDGRRTFLHWRGFKSGLEKDSVLEWRVNGYPLYVQQCTDRAPVRRGEHMRPCFPEKARCTNPPAVPKPTQVGGYKHTKARERNLVKELGNIAP